jgi:hypothetical protein
MIPSGRLLYVMYYDSGVSASQRAVARPRAAGLSPCLRRASGGAAPTMHSPVTSSWISARPFRDMPLGVKKRRESTTEGGGRARRTSRPTCSMDHAPPPISNMAAELVFRFRARTNWLAPEIRFRARTNSQLARTRNSSAESIRDIFKISTVGATRVSNSDGKTRKLSPHKRVSSVGLETKISE